MEELHRAAQNDFRLRLFWGVLDRYLPRVHVKKPQLKGGFDRLGEDAAATGPEIPLFALRRRVKKTRHQIS